MCLLGESTSPTAFNDAGASIPARAEVAHPAAQIPTLLTYCYNGRMVYVPAAENYDDALDIAQEVFPALENVSRSSVSFHIKFTPISEDKAIPDAEIQITPSTWGKIVTDLAKYNVVHLTINTGRSDTSAYRENGEALFWVTNRGNVGPATSYVAQVAAPGR